MPLRCRHITTRFAVAMFGALVLFAGCGDDSENANDNAENSGENATSQQENDGELGLDDLQCTAEDWECDEFVEGSDLSINRFRHHSALIDEDRVMLLGGSERLDGGGASSTDTWEVYDTSADVVDVESDQLPEPRSDFSVVQLPNRSVMVLGGEEGQDRVPLVDHVNPDSLEWTSLPEMNAPYRNAMTLDDGRVLVMAVTHSPDPPQLIGQTFDPETLEWSLTESVELSQDRVYNVAFTELSPGRIAVAYSHLAPPEEQPDMEGFETFHAEVLGVDLASGESEVLRDIDETTFGYDFDFTHLPAAGDFLLHLYTGEFDQDAVAVVAGDTVAYRLDPKDEEFEEHYVRNPSPGEVLEVLPGDEVIYSSEREVQLYEVETETWRTFAQLPEGIRFSTMDLLPDCRLFMAGERVLTGGERQGIQTAYCEPAE